MHSLTYSFTHFLNIGNTRYVPSTILALGYCCEMSHVDPALETDCPVWLSPSACDHCLRALEKAEENAQRLTGKPGQVLPHPELCPVRKDLHQSCPHCQVSVLGECAGKGLMEETLAEVPFGESAAEMDRVPAPENHSVGQDIEKAQLLCSFTPLFQSLCLQSRLDVSLSPF